MPITNFARPLMPEDLYKIDLVNCSSHSLYEDIDEKFDAFAHKIYNIISEHTRIDITENEFMELLRSE